MTELDRLKGLLDKASIWLSAANMGVDYGAVEIAYEEVKQARALLDGLAAEQAALVAENERLRGITKGAPYEVVQALTAERDAAVAQVAALKENNDALRAVTIPRAERIVALQQALAEIAGWTISYPGEALEKAVLFHRITERARAALGEAAHAQELEGGAP